MDKFNLSCPYRGPNPYKRMAKALKTSNVADNLLNREFEEYGPRVVLLTDITYLPYNGTFAYLSTVIDAFCVLSIENPQNRKENSPLSDREIPIIRKKHVESFRFFPYLVGKKAAFTAFCPIG